MGLTFGSSLISWYLHNKRELPWRETADPYKIWLSEVILQQTQVAQGLAYYTKFIRLFPTIQCLADASEDEVLSAWQGLGYYSRARNLHHSAKLMRDEYRGNFPQEYDKIRKLKGVGDYTAAAIASFAFDQPHAVVDGNVYRLLSRVFGISTPIDSGRGKKEFAKLASSLLDRKRPGLFNQAIMEFGSQYCRGSSPGCGECIFNLNCEAFKSGRVNELPVKSKTVTVRERFFNYLVIGDNAGNVVIKKRSAGDIWQGLYEFNLIESAHVVEPETLLGSLKVKSMRLDKLQLRHISKSYVHQLTHQRLHSRFYVLRSEQPLFARGHHVHMNELRNLAFPRLLSRFMDDCDLREMF